MKISDKGTITWILNVITWLFAGFCFLVCALLFPRIVSTAFPYYFGRLEGFTDRDLTYEGRCRLDNPRATFKQGGHKLVFGYIHRPGKKDEAHVWGENLKGAVVDISCPLSNDACRNRSAFAFAEVAGNELVITSGIMTPHDLEILYKNLPQLRGILISQGLM